MGNREISIKEYILRLLFPPRCIGCDMLLPIHTPKELCRDCEDNLPDLQRYEYSNPAGDSVGMIFSVFDYQGGIRKAIHHLKFKDKPSNASALIDLSHPILEQFLTPFIPGKKYDIIIPIPIHSGRKRQRGYNQSQLLAFHLARKMNIPLNSGVLVKKLKTPPQSTLRRGERLHNLRKAFQVKQPDRVKGQRILLVDDVMTTGSTLEQCGKILLEAGAIQVDAFVVAIRRKLSITEDIG